MVPGLYICAAGPRAGKNALIAGLGLRLQKEGFNVGYMKPVGELPVERDGLAGDEDAFYLQEALGLAQPPELVTPLLAGRDFQPGNFSDFPSAEARTRALDKIRSAYATLSAGLDIMLVSGAGDMFSGLCRGLDAASVSKALGVKALLLERVEDRAKSGPLTALHKALGEQAAGVVFNAAPPDFMPGLEQEIRPFLEGRGLPVLGVLPQDRVLGAVPVHTLAAGLNGRVLAARRGLDRMVEGFIIGAAQVENFLSHLRRLPHTALLTGGDRADLQLAALEDNSPCLVLTGNLHPCPTTLSLAEDCGAPVLLTREDTRLTAMKMETLMRRSKLREAAKISRAAQLVSAGLDFQRILAALGLQRPGPEKP